MKKIMIIAAVLVVVGVTGGLLFLKGKLNEGNEVLEEKIFETKSIQNIKIKADNPDIKLIPSDNETTRVLLTGKLEEDFDFKAEVSGDTLSIMLDEEDRWKFFSVLGDQGLTLQVFVPRKSYENIEVDLINGLIYAEKLDTNHALLEVTNGKIELTEIGTTSLNTSVENGEINLQDVDGNLIGDVTNGEIYLETDSLERNINFETVNGEIKIKSAYEPKNTRIEAKVTNGDVSIFGNSGKSVLQGSGNNEIMLTTMNGEISIDK